MIFCNTITIHFRFSGICAENGRLVCRFYVELLASLVIRANLNSLAHRWLDSCNGR
jgi:hypothetical protein